MSRCLSGAVTLLAVVLLPAAARAQCTHYVDISKTDGAHDGSAANPWRYYPSDQSSLSDASVVCFAGNSRSNPYPPFTVNKGVTLRPMSSGGKPAEVYVGPSSNHDCVSKGNNDEAALAIADGVSAAVIGLRISGCRTGIRFDGCTSNTVVRNCIVTGNPWYGLWAVNYGASSCNRQAKVENNTVVETTNRAYALRIGSKIAAANLTVRNNILFSTGTGGSLQVYENGSSTNSDPAGADSDYNILTNRFCLNSTQDPTSGCDNSHLWTGWPKDAHSNKTATPESVFFHFGSGAADYHLWVDSPAVEKGDPGYTAALHDIDGFPRQAGKYDVGAHEYVSCTPAVVLACETSFGTEFPQDPTCRARKLPNNTPCDDGSTCTDNDVCLGGTCQGGSVDGRACEGTGTCSGGVCIHPDAGLADTGTIEPPDAGSTTPDSGPATPDTGTIPPADVGVLPADSGMPDDAATPTPDASASADASEPPDAATAQPDANAPVPPPDLPEVYDLGGCSCATSGAGMIAALLPAAIILPLRRRRPT